jgi:hypothetical protein
VITRTLDNFLEQKDEAPTNYFFVIEAEAIEAGTGHQLIAFVAGWETGKQNLFVLAYDTKPDSPEELAVKLCIYPAL